MIPLQATLGRKDPIKLTKGPKMYENVAQNSDTPESREIHAHPSQLSKKEPGVHVKDEKTEKHMSLLDTLFFL